jgi:hypothetical protein
LLRTTLGEFVEALSDRWNDCNLSSDIRPAVEDVMQAFWVSPTSAEAEVWGSFPIEEDQLSWVSDKLASRHRLREVWPTVQSGEVPLHHPSEWQEAAMLLTPAWLRQCLLAAVVLHRAARPVVHWGRRIRSAPTLDGTR